MKRPVLLLFVLMLASGPVLAGGKIFLTVSKRSAYGPALDELTAAIENHNYTLIKIQPVDEGLRSRGYKSAAYKVLFFGNLQQVDKVIAAHPEAAVLLPLRIILYQQGDRVIASTPKLEMWRHIFGKELQSLFVQWARDTRAILMEFLDQ